MCNKPYNIRCFPYILVAILCFANLKVKVTEYQMLSNRFELSTPKLWKTKWITNYILRC